jgi:hypothetical protein
MLTYIASLILAHHHCPTDYRNPLCVPKGVIEEVAHRGSGRVDPNQPPVRQG